MTNQGKNVVDEMVSDTRKFHEKEPFCYWLILIFISSILFSALWGLSLLALKTAGTVILGTAGTCWVIHNFFKNWKITTEQKNEKDTGRNS